MASIMEEGVVQLDLEEIFPFQCMSSQNKEISTLNKVIDSTMGMDL